MTENKNEYLVIQDWMIQKLKLKGTALIVYAVIYGFSQDGESKFQGSLKYLMKWTASGKTSVINALKTLTEKGLINKEERQFNNMSFPIYSAKIGGTKSEPLVQKVNQGGTKSEPNNIYNNNIYYNNINKDILGSESEPLVQKVNHPPAIPPQKKELIAYFTKKISDIGTGAAAIDPDIEAEKFYSFYESKGWKVGKVKMTNWKAAVTGWVARNKKASINKTDKYNYGTGESW